MNATIAMTQIVTVREHGKLNGRRVGGPKSEIFVCRLPHAGHWLVVLHGLPLWSTPEDYWTAEKVAQWLYKGCLHGKMVKGFPILDEHALAYLAQRPEIRMAYHQATLTWGQPAAPTIEKVIEVLADIQAALTAEGIDAMRAEDATMRQVAKGKRIRHKGQTLTLATA